MAGKNGIAAAGDGHVHLVGRLVRHLGVELSLRPKEYNPKQ